MRHPSRVVALPGYKLDISYPDGVCGTGIILKIKKVINAANI